MYISRASIGDPAIESGKFMLTYADVCCHTSYIYIYKQGQHRRPCY
jgi:hypothetical protein